MIGYNALQLSPSNAKTSSELFIISHKNSKASAQNYNQFAIYFTLTVLSFPLRYFIFLWTEVNQFERIFKQPRLYCEKIRKFGLLIFYNLNITLMKIDPLLEKQLKWRFEKDNRSLLFFTRTKMFIHIEGDQWQQNCTGLLIIYQKKYTYGFTIVSTINLDVNFDFEMYSNFPNYTKYIGDLKCLIFLAPSQKNCLKIMLVLQSKTELSELKKQIDKIYNIVSKNSQVEFLNQPDVLQIMKKVPIEQNLLVKDLLFRQGVQDHIKEYFAKTTTKQQNKQTSGFKYYAVGRQEWKISHSQTQYLRSKFEAEIIESLSKLQKQAKIRNATK